MKYNLNLPWRHILCSLHSNFHLQPLQEIQHQGVLLSLRWLCTRVRLPMISVTSFLLLGNWRRLPPQSEHLNYKFSADCKIVNNNMIFSKEWKLFRKFWLFLETDSNILTYLLPSITGSSNKQSRVGWPAYLALKTDPSGSTSFFRILKSWFPGLSL